MTDAHRLRLATADEITKEVGIAEAAGFWFAAVRQPEPGLRYGFLFSASWPPPLDVNDEEVAQRVFHRVATGGGPRLALSIVTSSSSNGGRR